MKLVIVFALVAVALVSAQTYDSKYDNFNIDEVLDNKRLLHAYAHCFIGDGKCTPEGNDFKNYIPEGTKTSCAKCTDKQKVLVAKFVKAIKEQLTAEYESLYKQWDPENKGTAEFDKFLATYAN